MRRTRFPRCRTKRHSLCTPIGEHPDEDTRLVHADWPRRGTGRCRQRCTQAEFIRVQCEQSADFRIHDKETETNKRLGERANKLAADFEKEWFAGFPRCEIDLGVLQPRVPHAPSSRYGELPEVASPAVVPRTAAGIGTRRDRGGPETAHRAGAGLDGVRELNLRLRVRLSSGGDIGRRGVLWNRVRCGVAEILALERGFYLNRVTRHRLCGRGSRTYAKSPSWGDFSKPKPGENCWLPAGAKLEDLTIGHRGPWQTAERTRPGPGAGGSDRHGTWSHRAEAALAERVRNRRRGLREGGFLRPIPEPAPVAPRESTRRACPRRGAGGGTTPSADGLACVFFPASGPTRPLIALTKGPLMNQLEQLELSP